MKTLRIFAEISIFVIIIFMFIELFQSREEKNFQALEYQTPVFENNWTMYTLDIKELHGEELENYNKIRELTSISLKEGKCQEVSLPYTEKNGTSKALVFENTMPAGCAGMSLEFSSINAIIHIFADGSLIYKYGTDTNQMPPGIYEHSLNIPDTFQSGGILVILSPFYQDTPANISNINIKTYKNIMIGASGADTGCCLLVIIMSVIIFAIMFIRWYTLQPGRGELFLGFACLSMGIYCFIDTNILSLFYNIYTAYGMQKYLVLISTLFLALYFDFNLYKLYPYRFSIILLCTAASADIQLLLQVSGIRALEDMAGLSVLAVSLICITAIISMVQLYCKNRALQALPAALAIFILLPGIIINLTDNKILQYISSPIQYSVTISSIIITVLHVMQLYKEYLAVAAENARILREKIYIAEQQNIQLTQANKDADAARHEAVAANEAKGKFLAHMSHEIRTPINAVLGMDEMILRESKEQGIKDYAMDIYTAGQALLSLGNYILDFSKIESGKMEIVPAEYDTSSMIHDLANMSRQRAKDKNIKLEVEVSPKIPSRLYGDDVRIRQVLSNILTNAVKYTPEGTVWLRIHEISQTEDRILLKFEVEDTGIGIKEDDLPKLFAEFERIEEDRNRNIEGTGLGMNITIQLLSLMDSRLQVESIYGKGSKFYFELEQKIADNTPVGDFNARIHQTAENYNYSAGFCAPGAKILVVDDNDVNRKVLRNLLKETQIQVTEAAGGKECLELVQKNHYDLVFLDHMMPGMDGTTTLRHIKELSVLPDFPCRDTPVIVLTANAVSGAKEKYLSEGFDGFLSKPVVPDKLESMIGKMLPEELLKEPPAGFLDKDKKEIPEDFLEMLPQADGLDWHYAWLHLPDMELLEYTVKEFYAQITSSADKLEQIYSQITESGQLGQYRIQVHAMKSLAATIGIMPLSGVARILEYAARDGKTDTVLSITPAFLEEWRSYRKKLQGVFGIEGTPEKEVEDYSIILALIEMAKNSLQEMDIDQADQFSRQLQEYSYPDGISQNILKLAEAITSLDLEGAGRIADLLTSQIEKQQLK